MENCRAVWFTARRAVEIRPVPVRSPAQGELLVRSTYSGISPGTEMLAYRGDLDPHLSLDETIGSLGGTFSYPFRYGYSTVGVVEESRSHVPVGASVFVFHPHQELLTVPSDDVVAIGDHPSREATLFPLIETALQISLEAGLDPGDRAVVMGLGPVGALTALLLAGSGITVVGVDPIPWRREAISRWEPALLTTASPESVESMIVEGEGPVPLVIDASGNPAALRVGLRLLAHEGTLLVASWFGSRDVPLPLGKEFHRRRLTIRSTQVSSIPSGMQGEWDKQKRRKAVVDLMGSLPLSDMATHVFPLEMASDAYDAIDRGHEGLFHSALAYD